MTVSKKISRQQELSTLKIFSNKCKRGIQKKNENTMAFENSSVGMKFIKFYIKEEFL